MKKTSTARAIALGLSVSIASAMPAAVTVQADASSVSKEDTVYIMADAAGNETDTTVSSHLILDGASGSVKDTSNLRDIMNVKGDETFIKAWLRAQYAETIRETKAGAVNQDFDIIGGSFHKWVRDERDKLGLSTTNDFERFILKFSKFADVYKKIREAENTFAKETKYIYYNAQVNFTLQPQLLLAPICYGDTWPVIIEKMK